jgi:uncharacterized protein (DUF1684 family)
MTPATALELVDFRRTVAAMYAQVRDAGAGSTPHRAWIAARDELFRTHPQSALEPSDRSRFDGLRYWVYDRRYRIEATIVNSSPASTDLAHSGVGTTRAIRVGRVGFVLFDRHHSLDLFWFDAYGGGLFLPFKDDTCGRATYGGGRYLLDTAKGADLGTRDGRLVLDFNYAYHPSCVHSPRWSCPLASSANTLDVAVEAGERLTPD